MFPEEAVCEAKLSEVVWPNGPRCPRCGTSRVYSLPHGGKFNCLFCRKQFSLRSVTVFRSTKLSLRIWFLAAELFLRAHARSRARTLLTEERFAKDLGVSRMTSRRLLAVFWDDLAREDGGELGRVLCMHDRTRHPEENSS
ncbi:transposase [Roseovarius mucosus]|uniref:transposase n=1 Tax=Roseovarius mucosus TaxID=215743 RepID=UPI0035CFA9B8